MEALARVAVGRKGGTANRLRSYNDRNAAALTGLLADRWRHRSVPPSILEVGGGRVSRLDYPEARYTVMEVGEASIGPVPYAGEIIIGDVATVELGERSFDAVVFFNVLEHVGDPGGALERSAGLLADGGLLIVAGPETTTLKGLVTRYTPHALHVWFYRHILRKPSAGEPGHPPFPTHLAAGASPGHIDATATCAGCRLIYDERYLGPTVSFLRARRPLLYLLYAGANGLLRLISAGRLGPKTNDFVLVYEKAANAQASAMA